MLTFFDYLFYRFYVYCIRKKDETAFLRSVFYVFSVVLLLFGLLIEEIVYSLTQKNYSEIMAVVLFVICYIRYKRKRDVIVSKFNGLKFNKLMPIWVMIIIPPCLMFVGFYLKYFFMKWILKMPVQVIDYINI